MANKKIKLKNANGDYLLPYTTNVPEATSESAGIVQIENTITENSTKAITSGAVKTALDTKLNTTATAAKATADAGGNVITTTYATKTEVNSAQTTANEAKSIAEGRSRATSYSNYEALITALNSATDTEYKIGDHFYIQALGVPDLWVYAIENTQTPYTYTTNDALVTAIQTAGFVQIGYYKISALETEKVDLANYVPASRTINGKALSSNVTLTSADISDLGSNYLAINGTATRATADANGNNIATTYAKLSDVISYEEMD